MRSNSYQPTRLTESGDSKGGLGGPWPLQIFAWPRVWLPSFFLNFPFKFVWLCCDRKSRAAYAQSFALWQQATIEFTCHDHSPRTLVVTFNGSQVNIGRASTPRSLYYCLFPPHICMVLFFTHIPFVVNHTSTQHHRRGCNSSLPSYYSWRKHCRLQCGQIFWWLPARIAWAKYHCEAASKHQIKTRKTVSDWKESIQNQRIHIKRMRFSIRLWTGNRKIKKIVSKAKGMRWAYKIYIFRENK